VHYDKGNVCGCYAKMCLKKRRNTYWYYIKSLLNQLLLNPYENDVIKSQIIVILCNTVVKTTFFKMKDTKQPVITKHYIIGIIYLDFVRKETSTLHIK